MAWNKALGLLFFLVGTGRPVYSQHKLRPEIINYPSGVYQGQSQNWSVTQDENGFLFFGNNEGLLTFNGAQWQLYAMPKNQIVRCVAADRHGRIYTGGFGAFGYWTKTSLSGYIYHSLNHLIKDSLFHEEEIWKIIATDNQVLFQSFSRIYLLQGNRIRTVVAPGTILFSYFVRDHFYVNVIGKGIYRLDDSGTLTPITADTTLNDKRVTCILPYGIDQLLLGTDKDGLFLYSEHTSHYSAFETESDQVLRSGEINNGIRVRDNLFAIGTISHGVLLIDAKGHTQAWVNKANGLINNTILGLITDQSGNLWLALDKGVAQLVLKSNVAYFKDIEGRIGTVYCVAIFQDHIYVGSNHGLFEAPFHGMDDFQLRDLRVFPGISGQVWDLKVIDGQLLCGNNTGTYVIRAGQATKIYSGAGGWDIQAITGHPDGLVQGTYHGVVVYHKRQGQWQFAHMLKGTENMTINRIAVDHQGRLWVKHAYKGIFVIRADTSFNSVLNIRAVPALSTTADTQLDFFHYGDSILVYGPRGIFRLAGRGSMANAGRLVAETHLREKFRPYFQAERILADSGKGFWFIDDKRQVHYKDWTSGEIQDFPLNTNLFNMVRGFENIIAVNHSQSILTGEDGFVVLQKNLLNTPAGFPAPAVRQVRLIHDGRIQALPAKYRLTDGSLQLPYRLNSLEIDFSLPVFDRTVNYSFRLAKDDHDPWSEFSVAGQKEFSNLAPGNYQFQVRTQLSDRIFTMMIRIKNPWYFSVLARMIYLLVFILINILLWKWHKHRLLLQKQALTRKMQEALALEQEKNANRLLMVEQEKLSEEVIHKSEDLAKLAMELIRKKKAMKKLKDDLEAMKKQKDQGHVDAQIQKLSKSLNKYIQDEENDRHLFDNGFNKVHEAFFEKLVQQYPELTSQDLRLAAYLKMNLTSKEIAPLLNISIRGVEIKRYRLRKKLQLKEQENLSDFMLKF